MHCFKLSAIITRIFPRRLTSEVIFNNRLLFKNIVIVQEQQVLVQEQQAIIQEHWLLLSGNFCEGVKAEMEGDKIVTGEIFQSLLGKTLMTGF